MARITHGHSVAGKITREYNTWRSMFQRCYNPSSHNYARYGGRGIRICRRWQKFENFFRDMGRKPPGLTLERKNSNHGYSPKNCRWATTAEQNRNKSDTRKITWRGKTQSIAEWARELGVSDVTLGARLGRYNIPLERAMVSGRVQPCMS